MTTQRAREGSGSLVSWWISAAASVVTLLLVSLILGQPLSPVQIAGGLVVLLGIGLIHLRR